MLPSFYIQLFNTIGNVVEVCLIGCIVYLTHKNNRAFTYRAASINLKLDHLISLTGTESIDPKEIKVIRRETSSPRVS